MAITEKPPLELGPGDTVRYAERPLGVFTRPQQGRGWRDWLSTVDHKRIGILYGASAMFFFVVGGIEALLIRLQLAAPEGSVLSADIYNQVYTMHGVTMVFLFIMPLAAAFANYFIPLQIGARDVAFPRLNALSYWIWLSGAIFLNSSWMVGGGGADCGWFCYSPNSGVAFSPSHGVDFYAIGLQILGIASLVSAVNLIVTCLNLRAPGMTLMRMPVLTWMLLITQFLLLFALPVITVALFLLMFDRLFGAQFFNPDAGADPLLWQHLFWIFGHPEVYILILPAFGIVSEVIPTFSRKPLFGYEFMVFSGIAIGFMGWGVWAHHMFVSGIGPISVAAFSLSTMFIAVPTGVKVLNWLATMWGGKLRFTVAMKFAVATVAMFTIGGLSGVDPRGGAGRHPADRHLLHRGPLPLRDLRRRRARPVRRALLLVAQGVGPLPQRAPGQLELLDHAGGVQPHLRPDAHPGSAGDVAPHRHLCGRLWLRVLEHGGHHRGRC